MELPSISFQNEDEEIPAIKSIDRENLLQFKKLTIKKFFYYDALKMVYVILTNIQIYLRYLPKVIYMYHEKIFLQCPYFD